ncbi:MAG: hypothetical protein IH948_08120, partial [Bacteroidetes bacterium]|nr:hypothetical protein [Bacteroidota bacterium]
GTIINPRAKSFKEKSINKSKTGITKSLFPSAFSCGTCAYVSISNAGYFDLNFICTDATNPTGFFDPSTATSYGLGQFPPYGCLGQERREAVAQVFRDISQLVLKNPNSTSVVGNQNIQINILSEFEPSSSSIAYISAEFHVPSFLDPMFIDNVVYRFINSGYDPYSLFYGTPDAHATLTVNFAKNFFMDLNNNNLGNIASNQSDFYSTILHEILHALGIHSLLDPTTALSKVSPNMANGIYSRFDSFLEKTNGTKLIIPDPLGCYDVGVNPAITIFDLQGFDNTGTITNLALQCQTVFTGVEAIDVPVQTNTNPVGSALSHLIRNCTNPILDFIMDPIMLQGTIPNSRFPTLEEVKILCDLGYNLSGQYGVMGALTPNNTYTNYCINPCQIGAANDFLSKNNDFASATTVSYLEVASNDAGSPNLIDCIEIVKGGGNIVGTAQMSSGGDFDYLPDGTFTGQVIFRYIPKSGSCIGNVGYIYLTIDPPIPSLETCEPNCDNLICSGDFEDDAFEIDKHAASLANFGFGGDVPSPGTNSPDIVWDDGVTLLWHGILAPPSTGWSTCGIPSFTFPFPSDLPVADGGDRYIAFVNSAGGQGEAIGFSLNEPMDTDVNSEYNIEFIHYSFMDPTVCQGQVKFSFSIDPPCELNNIASNGPVTTTCSNSNPVYDYIPDKEIIIDLDKPDGSWQKYVTSVPFNVTEAYEHVVITVSGVNLSTSSSVSFYAWLDNIVLKKVNNVPLKVDIIASDPNPCIGDVVNYDIEVTNLSTTATTSNLTIGVQLPSSQLFHDPFIGNGIDDFDINLEKLIAPLIPGEVVQLQLQANIVAGVSIGDVIPAEISVISSAGNVGCL